jgi:hypothetical protein
MKARREFVAGTLAAGVTLIGLDDKTVAAPAGRGGGDQPRTGGAAFADVVGRGRNRERRLESRDSIN